MLLTLRRAPRASAREQDYVRAVAKRYASPDPASDWLAFHHDYSAPMRELVRKHPDHLDPATLFAESLLMLRPWQLWTADGEPADGTLELVAVLEGSGSPSVACPAGSYLLHDPDDRSRGFAFSLAAGERVVVGDAGVLGRGPLR